ncbi:MAG TPA: CehA/McbA family metallohydrolase [Pirellulaceae bacterium]|jgi:hypothetical protein|nr:CehA/McbA family metallohydrolase [Pirellulaceae bacterium]
MQPFLQAALVRLALPIGASLFVLAGSSSLAASPPATVDLPKAETWDVKDATVEARSDEIAVTTPINYRTGRVTSPATPARPGELFSVAADVRTSYAVAQQEYHEFWLEIEFLDKAKKVVQTTASPKLVGTQTELRPLGLTAIAPKQATAVRAVIAVVNKHWTIAKNGAVLRDLRLLKLNGPPGGSLEASISQPLTDKSGERTASVQVKTDWPDGAVVEIAADRGQAPPVAYIANGTAEATIRYSPTDVGSASATLNISDVEATLKIPDPRAASLSIARATADGFETPVRIRVTRGKEMLPGRYQETTPGIFATPPWSIEVAPGTWNVRVSRGPQFRSFERTIEAVSGKGVDLGEIEFERIVDLPSLGWYGGDADGDVYHGELIYQDVNADTAVEISQAMGLDWVGVGRWGVRNVGGPHPKTWGEAYDFMKSRSRDGFLFVWTDERPKSDGGHACFVGLQRSGDDRFGWGWIEAKTPLSQFQTLQMIRSSGAATFANHPLRWWMTGGKFRTNMYAGLPFELCASGLLDGLNINDRPENLELWSMLLDRGYRVAATAGADFGLDRPGGPVPGVDRMYCYCPDGMTSAALAEAVRGGRTVVSKGPTLIANLDGQPPGATVESGKTYRIDAKAWARGDEDDPLRRLELWSHGRAIDAKVYDKGALDADETFEWKPKGDWDWVAVRAVSLRGWAVTSAFYAKSASYQPPEPVECRLTLEVQGLKKADFSGASLEVWDGAPRVTGSKLSSSQPLKESQTLTVPASATLLVRLADGREKQATVYEASGAAELVRQIAAGERRQEPLLDWTTYEETLRLCREAKATVEF